MGADIHSHLEVKIAGKWHHYSCPPIQRWYALFEKIAGVRGHCKNAICFPRGLPTDLSLVTQICFYKDNADYHLHDTTWLNKEEFCELIKWADENYQDKFLWQHRELGYLTGNSFNLEKGSCPPEIEDVRFICWFDN